MSSSFDFKIIFKLIDRDWGLDDKIPLVNTIMRNVFYNEYKRYEKSYDTLLIVS